MFLVLLFCKLVQISGPKLNESKENKHGGLSDGTKMSCASERIRGDFTTLNQKYYSVAT